eukprot:2067129-Rhodomonas_salina.1
MHTQPENTQVPGTRVLVPNCYVSYAGTHTRVPGSGTRVPGRGYLGIRSPGCTHSRVHVAPGYPGITISITHPRTRVPGRNSYTASVPGYPGYPVTPGTRVPGYAFHGSRHWES